MRLDDANELFTLRSDPEVMRYVARPLTLSVAEAEAWIQNVITAYQNGEGITWSITVKPSDELAGTIGLWRFDKEHYRAEVGYMLHPKYQRKGLTTEALHAITRFAFENTELHSLEAHLSPENEASKMALQNCGFVQEAHFRENFFWNGRFEDTLVYSLLKHQNQFG
jgi:ribosomal-protein-alanine N-acetyltransferase